MTGILPEIVDEAAAPVDERNVVRPVEDVSQRVAIPGKAGVGEFPQRQGILALDEGQCAFALDLFQPQIRIVVGSCDRRAVVDGHEAPRKTA
jgi:hypothetical protein